MTDPLERDLEKYKQLLPTLSASEGKFALIVNAELKGIFDTYSDALAAGYKEAGLSPFLIQRIATTESVSYFTREIGADCPT
jgi:hypothetical protein